MQAGSIPAAIRDNLLDCYSIRKYIPAFEEKPDAWEFLERNQESEHNFERRQKLLEIRALLYKQLESTGDTRLFWKYIDYASSNEKMRNEIIYLCCPAN